MALTMDGHRQVQAKYGKALFGCCSKLSVDPQKFTETLQVFPPPVFQIACSQISETVSALRGKSYLSTPDQAGYFNTTRRSKLSLSLCRTQTIFL